MNSLKNIAILAHIDAGKTTLSERILFQGKTIHDIGNVEDGLATMDFLSEERRRGITIESGISYYNYKKEKVNLVDTPGHIDFGSEVDCVLSAIEGAVLVVSGVRGVQTQTLVNNQKLIEAKAPTLVFLNKIDLPEFKFDDSLIELEERFEKPILMLSLPCETAKGWGVIDVIAQKLIMTDGIESREFEALEIPPEMEYQSTRALKEIIETVAEIDDEVMECFLEKQIPAPGPLFKGLAKLVAKNEIMAVYSGSAKKNIGVRQLMNGVKFLIPQPVPVEYPGQVAKVIKVRHHADHPKIYLLKVIEESLAEAELFKGNLYSINAEQLTPISEVAQGDIVALDSELPFKIGDGILADGSVGQEGEVWAYDSLLHFKVEATQAEDVEKLGAGLKFFADIEPSMQLKYDGATGVYTVGAVGEVFFDVLVNRIRDEFGVEMTYGFPEVEKRESYQGSKSEFSETQETEWGKIEVKGYVNSTVKQGINLVFNDSSVENEDLVIMVIKGAIEEMAIRGILGQGRLNNLEVVIDTLKYSGRLLPGLLAKVVLHSVETAISKEDIGIEVPFVKLKLVAPEEYSNPLVADLNNREAKILNLDSNGKTISLEAEVSLERTFGYTTEMRNLTRGRGSHEIEYVGHF